MILPSPWKIRFIVITILFFLFCFFVGFIKPFVSLAAQTAGIKGFGELECTNYEDTSSGSRTRFSSFNESTRNWVNETRARTGPYQVASQFRIFYCQENAYGYLVKNSNLKTGGETWGGVCSSVKGSHPNMTVEQWNAMSVEEACSDGTCNENEEMTDCGCKPKCTSGTRIVPSCDCVPYCPYTNGRIPGTLENNAGLCVNPPCSAQELVNPDGSCTHNCTGAGQQMDVTTGECFKPTPNCGPCESLVNGDCEPPPACDAGTHRNYETCQCDDTPESPPLDCGKGHHYHWGFKKCVPDVICPDNGYYNGERCVDKVQPPENPDPKVDPKTDPTPTPDRPNDPDPLPDEQKTPDPPNPKSDDPWTAAVKEGIDRTNEQLKSLRDELAKHKTDLTWIQSTMKAVNENLGKILNGIKTGISEVAGRVEAAIGDGIGTLTTNLFKVGSGIAEQIIDLGRDLGSDLTGLKNGVVDKLSDVGTQLGTQITGIGTQISDAVKGIKDGIVDAINNLRGQLTGIDAGIGNVTEELRKINTGSYSKPADKEPYEAPEHDFNERTNLFLEAVKTSAIFSLPNQLSNGIPDGGSPILKIDTGSTYGGEVEIDFSALSPGILILRALFQIMGITLAIRIITLKR